MRTVTDRKRANTTQSSDINERIRNNYFDRKLSEPIMYQSKLRTMSPTDRESRSPRDILREKYKQMFILEQDYLQSNVSYLLLYSYS